MKIENIWWRNQLPSSNLPSSFNGVLESFLEVFGFWFQKVNSSNYFILINPLKIPKINLRNRPTNFRKVRWKPHNSLKLAETLQKTAGLKWRPPLTPRITHQWTVLLDHGLNHYFQKGSTSPQPKFQDTPQKMGRRVTYWTSIAPRLLGLFWQLLARSWFLLKDPLVGPWWVFPGRFQPNYTSTHVNDL